MCTTAQQHQTLRHPYERLPISQRIVSTAIYLFIIVVANRDDLMRQPNKNILLYIYITSKCWQVALCCHMYYYVCKKCMYIYLHIYIYIRMYDFYNVSFMSNGKKQDNILLLLIVCSTTATFVTCPVLKKTARASLALWLWVVGQCEARAPRAALSASLGELHVCYICTRCASCVHF